jgi:hypothetical protein
MPHRKKTGSPDLSTAPTFRQRYDELEHKRRDLIERLERTGGAHPSARKAMTLLNRTFRAASIVQRAAILQAADWLISVIELGGTLL